MIRTFKVEIEDSLRDAEKDIDELERKWGAEEIMTGKWIYQKGYVPYKWKCNQCSAEFKTDFHFCPNCGCRMVEPRERSE